MLAIGLMSGTSMDGIDAALLETDGTPNQIIPLGHVSLSYDPEFKILLKVAEYAVRKCHGDLGKANTYFMDALYHYLLNELNMQALSVNQKISELAVYLYGISANQQTISLDDIILRSTNLHSMSVKNLLQHVGISADKIDVVGYHGQTMYHHPSQKISVIVGDGQYLANQLGITVVNDFRRNDINAGGQGAPFAPVYHQALAIRDNMLPLAVVNCGGIANITLIQNAKLADLVAFDTGPGNGLLDKLVRLRTQGRSHMDTDGNAGKQGRVNQSVLNALYAKSIIKDKQNYFTALPPKSLDIGDMQLIPELDALSFEDACRTLAAFTADTIVNSLTLSHTMCPTQWILAGGGFKNPVIRHELETRLKEQHGNDIRIMTADEAGWCSQAMEAQIFAYLAVRSLQNQPLSVPGTTRVPEPLSGGHAYLPEMGPTASVSKLLALNPHYNFKLPTP